LAGAGQVLNPGDLVVQIQGVTGPGGEPNGTVLSSQTVPQGEVPASGAVNVELDSPVPVQEGEQYAIVLTSTAGTATFDGGAYRALASPGDQYAPGSQCTKLGPQPWTCNASLDLIFATAVTPAPCAGVQVTVMDTTGVVSGTPGDDVLSGDSGNNQINGGGGNDVICGRGGDDTIVGGDGDDRIQADAGDDNVRGGAGADRIFGGDGEDILAGQAGADRIFGEAGDDSNLGGADNDVISDAAGNDGLFGEAGNDTLSGGGGNDNVSGDADNDGLTGGAGTDTCNGGTGTDTASCESVVGVP
jgi:Ca2+-binding RTX toxin-like protein